MVASDRISAYDFVLDTTIPDKGEILTRMSLWWFDQLAGLVPQPRHLHRRARRPSAAGRWSARRSTCTPSSAWPAATSPAPGSSTTAAPARSAASPCPAGLQDGSRLPEPIFTPATKAARRRPRRERRPTRRSSRPSATTRPRSCGCSPWRSTAGRTSSPASRGIILADTKVEFGARADGTTVLADEVLTPDSSRFWPADAWQPGRAAAVVRQADRPRLAHLGRSPAGTGTSGEAPPAAAARGRRAHPRAVRRGLRAADRGDVLTAFRASVELPVPGGGGLRLPLRPAQPAAVAVLAALGHGAGRRGAAPRPALAGDDARSACGPGSRSSRWTRPLVWTERGWWRGVDGDAVPALRRVRRAGAASRSAATSADAGLVAPCRRPSPVGSPGLAVAADVRKAGQILARRAV